MISLDNISLGSSSDNSGHQTFKAAYDRRNNKRLIVKQNKNGQSKYTWLEHGLSQLSALFLAPHLTAPTNIVTDNAASEVPGESAAPLPENKIYGLAVQHYGYQALLRKKGAQFYTVEKQGILETAETNTDGLPPIYFLDQFHSRFFSDLYARSQKADEDRDKIVFDWQALASVLSSAYTLEEDDLHKGNIGFYICEGKSEQCPRVVFFSIDHDLKLAHSIMSFHCSRMRNLYFSDGAYKISKRDLINLPYIRDSQNYYWPTRWRFWFNFYDSKVYKSRTEIQAFVNVGKHDVFIEEKWLALYKHVLIPPDRIREVCMQSFAEENKQDTALANVFSAAIIERQAQLKAVLFSVPEFRNALKSFSDDDIGRMLNEIAPATNSLQRHARLVNQVMKERALLKNFVENDTPLHAAIRLGDYRYQQTWAHFKEFARQKNGEGDSALDLAIKQGLEAEETDPRRDYGAIASHLYRKNVPLFTQLSPDGSRQKALREGYSELCRLHANKAVNNVNDVNTLITILAEIGRNHSYCLKFKKQVANRSLNMFLDRQKQRPRFMKEDLERLYNAINGKGNTTDNKKLQYIRQLRSRYWIIRKIRGMLGGSATQLKMSEQLKNYEATNFSSARSYTLFGAKLERKAFVGPRPDLQFK